MTLTHRYQKHTCEQIYIYTGANLKILITINQMYGMKQSSLMSLLCLLPLSSWIYVIPPPQRAATLTTSIIHPSTNSSAGPTYVPKHVCRLRWSDVKGDKGRGHLKARYLVSRPQLWRASLSSPIAYCKDNPSQSSDGARRDIKDSYQVWLNLADAAPRARHVLRPPVGCLVLPSIIKTAYWPRKRVAFSLLFFPSVDKDVSAVQQKESFTPFHYLLNRLFKV